MIRTEFAAAINQICSERGIKPEVVIDTIKNALLAAYKKDYGVKEDLEVELNPETGEAKILESGKDITPPGFGRIAAQTAKQVILQRIREAEKEAIFQDYQNKIGEVISSMVQRFEGPNIILDVGRATGIMPSREQVPTEKYRLNQRVKVLIKDVRRTNRGYEIILSRSDKLLVKKLFELEVPEIHSGAVEVVAVSREAGSRSKVAVLSHQDGVDPIGSCVGQRGVRVQAITRELYDEKIDIISWSDDPIKFIAASLSPAKVTDIKISKTKQEAKVFVSDDQLSLAIGKEGQNVRLAAKLTGWKIDIKQLKERKAEKKEEAKEKPELEEAGLSKRVINVLSKAKIETLDQLREKKDELKEIKGLGKKSIEEIQKVIEG